MSQVYAKLLRYKEAESAFLKALEMQGDQKAILASLGTLYVHMEKYDDAITTLKKALESFHKPSVLNSYKDMLRHRWETIPEESL